MRRFTSPLSPRATTWNVRLLCCGAVGIEAVREFHAEGGAILLNGVLGVFGAAGERILLVEQIVDAYGNIRAFAERVADQRGVQDGESSQRVSGQRRDLPRVLFVQCSGEFPVEERRRQIKLYKIRRRIRRSLPRQRVRRLSIAVTGAAGQACGQTSAQLNLDALGGCRLRILIYEKSGVRVRFQSYKICDSVVEDRARGVQVAAKALLENSLDASDFLRLQFLIVHIGRAKIGSALIRHRSPEGAAVEKFGGRRLRRVINQREPRIGAPAKPVVVVVVTNARAHREFSGDLRIELRVSREYQEFRGILGGNRAYAGVAIELVQPEVVSDLRPEIQCAVVRQRPAQFYLGVPPLGVVRVECPAAPAQPRRAPARRECSW